MKNRNIVLGIVLVIILIGAIYLMLPKDSGDYDEFAQCLTDSGAKMYGAFWCSHCTNQKKMFGTSWSNINYIECSTPGGDGQTLECQQAGISGYPTWEFADSSRISGEVTIAQLSQKTGCVP
ncbi:hypothetical protein GW923_02360 [Candidatus Pacearchaeota archaeon]|nr:hypothetical protein [Candidatus Pacearchaeota archaeon]PJB94136.1 MAG: hypothetical protein CO081_02195 [Candidatus Pacearchaeota archaeon CG_4_9_14_0_8_um_filter_35_24]